MSDQLDSEIDKLARTAFKVGYQVAKDDLEANAYDVELATGHSPWIRRIKEAKKRLKEEIYADRS